MKVKDLIVHLSNEDPEATVHFAYGYGDHWRTTVAPEVTGLEEGRVVVSTYHDMDKVIEEDENGYEEARAVVLLT